MQLIPAIDLLDGEVVRLRQGDFDRRTRYPDSPAVLLESFRDAGAELVHVVDLNAARGDARNNRDVIKNLADLPGVRIQCGGGVRRHEDVSALLDAGVARVVIGSLAVRDPECVIAWLETFGSERIVLALDVKTSAHGEPRLLTQGWREESEMAFWPLLARYCEAGLAHLLCTDSGRDGMLAGPNHALYRDILQRHPQLGLQASGGVTNVDDLRVLRDDKVPAVILGRALLEGRVALSDAQEALA